MKRIVTDRMKELIDLGYPLEELLEKARLAASKVMAYESPEREEVRRLRRELAVIDNEIFAISLEVNKEWHAQKPIGFTGCWQRGNYITAKDTRTINQLLTRRAT